MENTVYISIAEAAAAGNTGCRFCITTAPPVWQIRLTKKRAAHGYKRYRNGIKEFFHFRGTSPAADNTDMGLSLQFSGGFFCVRGKVHGFLRAADCADRAFAGQG